MKRVRKIIALSLIAVMMLTLSSCGQVKLSENLDKVKQETVEYIVQQVEEPGIASVGGDWLMRALAMSGLDVDEDFVSLYYDNVRAKVKSEEGKIHDKYYSDYARATIGVVSIGKDPTDIEGYDITKSMDNYKEITDQGMTAVAYTLVAANIAGVKLDNEEAYLNYLKKEVKSFIDSGEKDTDYLSMSLVGLSLYTDREDIKALSDQGVEQLSKLQDEDGTFGSCESTAEAIIALSQLKIDVFEDSRFVKNDVSLGDSLIIYRNDEGGFAHTLETDDKETDLMSTERALLAMDSMSLFKEGKALYERK